MDRKTINSLAKGDYIELGNIYYVISRIQYTRSTPRYFSLTPLMPNINSYIAYRDTLLVANKLDDTSPEIMTLKVLYGP